MARNKLRPIVPVVFYQSGRDWNHSTEFSDLFPEAARALPWVARFAHELLDQTTLDPDEGCRRRQGPRHLEHFCIGLNTCIDWRLQVSRVNRRRDPTAEACGVQWNVGLRFANPTYSLIRKRSSC